MFTDNSEVYSIPQTDVAPGTEQYTLDSLEMPVKINENITAHRAAKYDVALGLESPGKDVINQYLIDGREGELRNTYAARLNAKDQALRYDLSRKYAANTDTIDPTVIQDLQTADQYNPDLLFERRFGDAYSAWLLDLWKDDPVFKQQVTKDPNAILDQSSITAETVSKNQYARKNLEDLKIANEHMGWVDWGWNQVEGMVPLLAPYQLNAVLKTPMESSILPGKLVEDKVANMWLLPLPQFKDTYDKVMAELKERNPLLAQMFAQAVLQYSSTDAAVDTAFAAANALDLALPVAQGVMKPFAAMGRKAAEKEAFRSGPFNLAAEARDFTPEELKRIQVNTAILKGEEYGKREVLTPRMMTNEELANVEAALPKSSEMNMLPQGRQMTDYELSKVRAGVDAISGNNASTGFLGAPGRTLPAEGTIALRELESMSDRLRNYYGEARAFTPEEMKDIQQRFKDAVKPLNMPVLKVENIAAATGNIPAAARSTALEFIANEQVAHTFDDLASLMPSFLRPDAWNLEPSRLSAERARALITEFNGNAARLLDTLRNVRRVQRTTPEATVAGLRQAEQELTNKLRYKGLDSAILNARHEYDPIVNKHTSVVEIGKTDKTLFATENQARMFATTRLRLGSPENYALRERPGVTPTKEPPVADGYIRVYHGGSQADDVTFRKGDRIWVSTSKYYAAGHGDKLWYVDIPASSKQLTPTAPGQDSKAGFTFNFALDDGLEDYNPNLKLLGSLKKPVYDSKTALADTVGNIDFKPQGGGWFIEVRKDIDETKIGVRNQMVLDTNPDNVTPSWWGNVILGWARSSKDRTSPLQGQARNTVTHSEQFMKEALKEIANQSFGKLSKDEKRNLSLLMERDRELQSFLRSFKDFELEYHSMFNSFPSEAETRAYFTSIQMNDFDWITRNLDYNRDLSRQGIQHYRVPYFKEGGDTKYRTEYFYGRTAESLPIGEHGGVLVIDETNKTSRYYRLDNPSHQAFLSSLKNDLIEKQGYDIIQIANPIDRPLSDAVNGQINFVVTKDAQNRPLALNMIPYNPGGHKVYPNPHLVKQPVINAFDNWNAYQGDKTFLGFETSSEAKKYSSLLEEARKIYKDGDMARLRIYLQDNLPEDEWSFDKFINKIRQGIIDPDQPFVYVPSGQRSLDIYTDLLTRGYKDRFFDESKSKFNLMQLVDTSFMAERDDTLRTIKEWGSEYTPKYNTDTARLVDPTETLYRSVSQSINAHLYTDYKFLHVESWIKQFGDYLNVSTNSLHQNPLFHMQHPQWREGVDTAVKVAAMQSRNAALEFLNMDPPDVKVMKFLQNKTLDAVYESMGQPASDFVATHLLPTVKDPVGYLRGIVFDAKMGMFNPPQFLNQANTMVHALAVAGPVRGVQGMAAGTATSLLRLTENESAVNLVASRLRPLGWEADEFKEAYNLLKTSGWYEVQGETIWRNTIGHDGLIVTGVGKVREWGRVFFQEGERLSRLTGWFAAYKEWRAANPGHVFGIDRLADDTAVAKILDRADLMNVNMTRSSMSAWQHGVASIPTQFMGYYTRLTEQMLGHRLSPKEKLRVVLTYSAMYGIPTGALVYPWANAAVSGYTDGPAAATLGAVGQWPGYEALKRAAIEHNIDLDSSWYRPLLEGIPGAMLEWATGEQYGKRYAPTAPSQARDLLSGDKKWYEVLWGVSGEFYSDVFSNIDPFFQGVYAALKGSPDFKVMGEDVLDMTKQISSANNALKAFWAYNYGEYITKNGVSVVGDLTKVDAIVQGVFGLTRQDIESTWHTVSAIKLRAQGQKETEARVKKELRSFYRNITKDEELANRHLLRAQWYLNMGQFNDIERARITKEASKGYEYLRDEVARKKINIFGINKGIE